MKKFKVNYTVTIVGWLSDTTLERMEIVEGNSLEEVFESKEKEAKYLTRKGERVVSVKDVVEI